MKHFTSLGLALALFTGIKAQEVFVPINYSALEKKIAKSEIEIADPKKNMDPKTWVRRGEAMLSAYEVDLEQIYEGMNPTNLTLFYPDPVTGTEEINGVNYETYSYERIRFYFDNNALAMWKKTTWAYDKPLAEAYRSFLKASELDQEGKLGEKLTADLTKLNSHLKKFGINCYYAGSKEDALENFELVLLVNKIPVLKGVKDTLLIQYSGIIARELGMYQKSVEHYEELSTIDNEPNTFLLIKEDYLKLQDTVKALSTMERGFQKFPDTLSIVANLVDLYIRTNQIKEGLTTIESALSQNPNKGELYYWKGRLQLNTTEENRIDQALASYAIAVEKSPSLYYAYYDIGFIYFLQGQDLFTRAGEEKDKEYREEMIKVATEHYNKSLPNLEKALELNTSNMDIRKETLDTLKRVYYKLQMNEKYDEASEMLRNL